MYIYIMYIYIYLLCIYIYIICRETFHPPYSSCAKNNNHICRPAALNPPMRSMRCKSGLPDTDPIF